MIIDKSARFKSWDGLVILAAFGIAFYLCESLAVSEKTEDAVCYSVGGHHCCVYGGTATLEIPGALAQFSDVHLCSQRFGFVCLSVVCPHQRRTRVDFATGRDVRNSPSHSLLMEKGDSGSESINGGWPTIAGDLQNAPTFSRCLRRVG